MNADSDDEISKLRNAALLTRASNMRRRKVTLINSKKTATGEHDGDKRQILIGTRNVVIGASSEIQSQTTGNDFDSHWPMAVMDSYPTKKAKLQNDRQILSVGEEQVETMKDQRIFAVEQSNTDVGLFGSKTDVRIILNDINENGASVLNNIGEQNELSDFQDEAVADQTYVELDESTDVNKTEVQEEAEAVVTEERLSLRKILRKSSEEGSETENLGVEEENVEDSGGKDNFKEVHEEADEKEAEEKEDKQEESEEEERDREEENESEKTHIENGKDSSGEKEQKDNEILNVYDVVDKSNTQPEKEAIEDKSKGRPNNSKKKDSQKNGKTVNTTSKEKKQKKLPKTDDNSDDGSSGSESYSSHSGGSSSSGSSSSSSSYSGSSSSSRSSSGSRSTSSSRSYSDSDDEKRPKASRSSKSFSRSSSYSYSTGGTPEKSTMRSVVSKKRKDSRSSGSPHRSPRGRSTPPAARARSLRDRYSRSRSPRGRSPYRRSSRGRWSPRDRIYSDRRRSFDDEDRFKRDRRNNVRAQRDGNPGYSRRRSPHSRLGKRHFSPPRFSRRSRDRDRTFIKSNERSRRTRSRSLERKNDFSASDKHSQSRTDDDFVEVDITANIKESRLKKSGRLGETKVDANVRKSGFDLRSKLGAKKIETKPIARKKGQVDKRRNMQKTKDDARQKLEQRKRTLNGKQKVNEINEEDEKTDEEEFQGDVRNIVTSQVQNVVEDDKETELDAKILRIQMMNEAIRKRQEEIEREKKLFN